MKVLVPILIGLLVVGCGKSEAERLLNSVVGTYEINCPVDANMTDTVNISGGWTIKIVFLKPLLITRLLCCDERRLSQYRRPNNILGI
jgi:hypothetical protein